MPGKGSSAAMRTAQVVRVHGMKGVESVSGENPVVNYSMSEWGAFKKALLKANMASHGMSVLELDTKNTASTYVCQNILHRM